MNWISVKERLPDVEIDNLNDPVDDVLILYKTKCDKCHRCDDDTRIGIGYVMDKIWLLTEPLGDDLLPANNYSLIKVTHWMLLPEFPNE